MADVTRASVDWTEPEQWVWERIAAGEPADLNARDREHNPDFKDLDPCKEEGWGENRRLRVKFLQTILTQKDFADATPYGGVRVLGALVEDAPLDLEHARLQRLFWLERSRILTDVKCRNLRVDGGMSLEASFVAGGVELPEADVLDSLSVASGKFKGELNLVHASIGSNLAMTDSIFEKKVNLNSAKVDGAAFLRGAAFKGELNLGNASIGSNLEMKNSLFKKEVNLNSAKVDGAAFLNGAAFEGEVDLGSASIGSLLVMTGSTFKGKVELGSASIGLQLVMDGSAFEQEVDLNSVEVKGAAVLRDGATFKGNVNLSHASIGSVLNMTRSAFEQEVNLNGAQVDSKALFDGATFAGDVSLVTARIGSNLDVSDAKFGRQVDLTGCQVKGEFRLGSSEHPPARWGDAATLVLRNAHVGALQDWWQDSSNNSWPKVFELEGFTYDRLGGLYGKGKEANMMARPSACYVEWLRRDPSFSLQPYEQLAHVFRRAGDPAKASDILYEARERRRRLALSKVDDQGHPKDRDVLGWLGLWGLHWTIGYGLGNRYFWSLWWVLGLTVLGTVLLITAGRSLEEWDWSSLSFASLDQLLPIVSLNKAHDTLIFGDSSASPPVDPQPYGVVAYFYLHKIIGWVLATFIVAGLAGLTQRN